VTDGTQELVHRSLTSRVLSAEVAQALTVLRRRSRAVGFCACLTKVVTASAVSACNAWSRHQMVGW